MADITYINEYFVDKNDQPGKLPYIRYKRWRSGKRNTK